MRPCALRIRRPRLGNIIADHPHLPYVRNIDGSDDGRASTRQGTDIGRETPGGPLFRSSEEWGPCPPGRYRTRPSGPCPPLMEDGVFKK